MESLKLHDEIMKGGRRMILDTCIVGERYETALLRPDGIDIEMKRAATPEGARKNHAALLAQYTEQPRPALSGKYAKLRDDLRAAWEASAAADTPEDGGTCNFDAPALLLPRWTERLVEQAAEEAGGSARKWSCYGAAFYVFSFPFAGQAARRTRRAEAMKAALAALGYDTTMYYQCD